jgi:hypothetical protein
VLVYKAQAWSFPVPEEVSSLAFKFQKRKENINITLLLIIYGMMPYVASIRTKRISI